jgi:hypothetical protein
LALAAAVPVLLWFGRDQWFFLDEWAFFVHRELGDVSSMLEPHNGHWVTLPAVFYRVNFRLFGIDSYLPYQLPLVLVHVGIVALLWLTMRRLGVRPAIAALTALPFAFFGAGSTNIVFAFQIALTGALFCGLAQLLLADHDPPTDRRDAIGVAFGLVGIMCSAVGVPLVIGVAVAVLIRRGWRPALLHAVPLGVVYIAWYISFASGRSNREYYFGPRTVSFVAEMGRGAFVGLGQSGAVGLALAASAAIGVVASVRLAYIDRQRAPVAVVAALLVSFLAFGWFTAIGRVDIFGVVSAATERYAYVAAALFLPLVALGAEYLAQRWLVLGLVPVALLAIGLPGNVDGLRDRPPYSLGSRNAVVAVAHSDLLDQLPPDTALLAPEGYRDVAPTAGWLRSTVADGRLSAPEHLTAQQTMNADLTIALVQGGAVNERECPVLAGTPRVRVDRGDRIVFSDTINVVLVRDAMQSSPRSFTSGAGDVVEVRAGPVDLEVAGPREGPPAICRIDRR